MKYKLINSLTKIETLCEKITIDGFDYFVSNEKINEETLFVDNNKLFKCRNIFEIGIEDDEGLLHKFENSEKVIATNNPNIEAPKMVDEVERLKFIYNEGGNKDVFTTGILTGIEIGYNKSQETHSNSDVDMIEFAEWRDWYLKTLNEWKVDGLNGGDKFTTKELLQIWKESKAKIVYYE